MKPRSNISAAQMALLSVAGAAIASLCFVSIAIARKFVPHHSTTFLTIALGSFVFLIAGFYLCYRAESALKNGIANNRWPAGKIDSLRSHLQSPAWNILIGFSLISYVLAAFPLNHSQLRTWGFIGFIIGMMLIRLRNAVTPPKSSTQPSLLDWRTRPPLKSDHWGER